MSLIKHKNGRFSVFSNMVDDFIAIDITLEEYIELRKRDLERDLILEIEGLLIRIENFPERYKYSNELDIIENIHGKERRIDVEKFLPKE